MKHTPGPWFAHQDQPNYGTSWFIGSADTLVAEVNDNERHRARAPTNPEADARLLAAAPELYAACLAAAEALEGGSEAQRLRATREIHAAIEKAERGSAG